MDEQLNKNRLFLENQHFKNRIYRESEILSKVNKDSSGFRSQLKLYEDQVDPASIDHFKEQREQKGNRSQQRIHQRFPSLQGQRDFAQISGLQIVTDKQTSILPIPRKSLSSFKNYTLASALKIRKIVQPEMLNGNSLNTSQSKVFVPVNPSEAKETIVRTIQYDHQKNQKEENMDKSFDQVSRNKSKSALLQNQAFKRTSPSPNHLSKNTKSLNDHNKFHTFLPSELEQPRLNILHNFKEINRIMTNSFLKHKDQELKFKKQQIPHEILKKQRFEKECTSQMTSLMKKMNSPKNFQSPSQNIQSTTSSITRVMPSPLNNFSATQSNLQIESSIRQTNKNIPSTGESQHNTSIFPQIKMQFNQQDNYEVRKKLNNSIL